jgi:UDP-N-acetylglucosamine 4-epimerase
VRALTGASVEPKYAPERAGDVRDSQADISKAQRLLGYAPTVPFAEGLARTVAWFKNVPAGVV